MWIFETIPTAHAGVITDAPNVSDILMNVLNFALSIIGILGIVGLVVAGGMYFLAAGDEKALKMAKGIVSTSVVGLAIAFGCLMLVMAIGRFFTGN